MTVAPELESMPENLLRAPLDFLFADHFRKMLVCNFIDAVAANAAGEERPRLARAAHDYLARDLPLHIADEEDLFQRLASGLAADDWIGPIIARLGEEHREDWRLATALIDGLGRMAKGEASPPEFASTALAFTAGQRRHVAWENGVLLPEARKRLDAAAAEAIGRRMAARRGVSYPDERAPSPAVQRP